MKKKSKNNSVLPLFYWSEIRFLFKKKENYGDLLSKYLVEKISGKEVKWIQPKKQPWYKFDKRNYLAIGSILSHASKKSIIWGSGIIDSKHKIVQADFRAVRGPRTQQFLENSGIHCPKVFGDPAILLPDYYLPAIEKTYRIGIIPHYNDYLKIKDIFQEDEAVKVINLMTLDIKETTNEILSCEMTISSSLHGLIVSHAYEIPSIWVEFSNKIFGDGIKYPDYLESLDIPVYKPPFINDFQTVQELESLVKAHPNLPDRNKLMELKKQLIKVCPFKE